MRCKFIFIILIIFFLNVSVSAEYYKGNKSHELATSYAKGASITGWVNLSFQEEPSTTIVEIFDSKMSLIDFLENTSAKYECFPDCEYIGYDTTGLSKISEAKTLDYMEDVLFGIKLTGNLSDITSFKFNVGTNAQESCHSPLVIDVLDGDKKITWKAKEMSASVCGDKIISKCFDMSQVGEFAPLAKDSEFCQEIVIPAGKELRAAANINGTGNIAFGFKVESESSQGQCTSTATSPGQISCDIEFETEILKSENATICLIPTSQNNYSIAYEDEPSVCGSIYDHDTEEEYAHDLDLFIYALKYSWLQDFEFNNNLFEEEEGIILEDEIESYLIDKYDLKCDPECIIPFRLTSGVSGQDLNINSLELGYKVAGIKKDPINNFYYIEGSERLINSNFQKIYLDNSGFSVPDSLGNKMLELKINNNVVLFQNISIKGLPVIKTIIPNTASAFIEAGFVAIMETPGNYTYKWEFGDNSTQITSTNTVKHTYNNLSSYTLKLTVTSGNEQVSKSIQVDVISTAESINQTIRDYRLRMNNFTSSISTFPVWIKDSLNKKVRFSELDSRIKLLEQRFKDSLEDKYFEIIKSLNELKVPSSVKKDTLIKVPFYNRVEELNLDVLEYFYEGKVNVSQEEHTGAVNSWIKDNVDINSQIHTYSVDYSDESSEILFSEVILTFIPDERGVTQLYMIISEQNNNLEFAQDYSPQEIQSSTAITLDNFDKEETIDFLYPGSVNQFELPIFISPGYYDIPNPGDDTSVCDRDKVCEKGENWKNCRIDCKPVGMVVLLILILIFVALIVYVILQEWYKRHYERHLFSDRNQLFNLVNFMYISGTQGLRKSDIFSKLQEIDWRKEQLNYAWNKLNGKRTGMWEIPIFKWAENKTVKKEIDKRRIIDKNKPRALGNPSFDPKQGGFFKK